MIPIGFEFAFRRPLNVVSSRPEHWETARGDLRDFIRSVNDVKTAHPVFQEDAPIVALPSPHPKIAAFWKASAWADEEALLFLNTDSGTPSSCRRCAIRCNCSGRWLMSRPNIAWRRSPRGGSGTNSDPDNASCSSPAVRRKESRGTASSRLSV
jgi:hypothetical protein